jgi:hypothetical protein
MRRKFIAGMKAQCDGGGGRPLMGERTGGRAVVLGPIRLQCVGDWIHLGFLIYIYIHILFIMHSYAGCAKFELSFYFRKVNIT